MRKPTKDEIDDPDQFPQYQVTYETPEYDPEQRHYKTVEEAIRDELRHDVVSEDTRNRQINLVHVVADRVSSTQNEVYFQRQVIAMLSVAKRKGLCLVKIHTKSVLKSNCDGRPSARRP